MCNQILSGQLTNHNPKKSNHGHCGLMKRVSEKNVLGGSTSAFFDSYLAFVSCEGTSSWKEISNYCPSANNSNYDPCATVVGLWICNRVGWIYCDRQAITICLQDPRNTHVALQQLTTFKSTVSDVGILFRFFRLLEKEYISQICIFGLFTGVASTESLLRSFHVPKLFQRSLKFFNIQ